VYSKTTDYGSYVTSLRTRNKNKENGKMGIDLEAIRRKVEQLKGGRRSGNIQFWKPDVGEHVVRIVPWPEDRLVEGSPFIERSFYYIGKNRALLAPRQFGKADPVNDVINSLYNSGVPEDKEIAKKLFPSMYIFACVLVRGEEEKGLQVWKFNKTVYQRLLSFFLDPDTEDFCDPHNGRDLKVKISLTGKVFNNNPVKETTIDPKLSTSPLVEDDEQLSKLLENIPNVDDVYQLKPAVEIERVLNSWLDGDDVVNNSEGTTRGEEPSDKLEELANEVGASNASDEPAKPAEAAAKKVSKKASKKAAKKSKKDDADDELNDSAPKKSLDDAFNELMSDSE
jgi:hypothetical protein